MESRFECSVPCSEPITRDLVLSTASRLRRLVSEKGGCPPEALGGGVTLYCGPNVLRFDTPEELSSLVPPLTGIDGFRMTFFSPPSSPDGVSLFVGKPADADSFSVIALADTPARAQELALEVGTLFKKECRNGNKHYSDTVKKSFQAIKRFFKTFWKLFAGLSVILTVYAERDVIIGFIRFILSRIH